MSAARIAALTAADFEDALHLYRALTRDPVPVTDSRAAFDAVLSHPGTTVFGASVDGHVRAMITLHLLPNMTSGGRPYGLVENVVTDPDWRGRGLGRDTLQAGLDHAAAAGAYKVMLLTGSGRGARGFYEKLGFSDAEKHGMVMRFSSPGSIRTNHARP